MRLVRLKILSEFRGLPPGFELHFGGVDTYTGLRPICLVGLNGSGKSNVLSVISEIFFRAELFARNLSGSHRKRRKNLALGFGFELEYMMDAFEVLGVFAEDDDLMELLDQPRTKPHDYLVKIHKQPGKEMRIGFYEDRVRHEDVWLAPDDMDRCGDVLPRRVIGYSSGANELISNPYIRMDMQYYDLYRESGGNDGITLTHDQRNDRMFFMDYDSNKLVTICNFLFRDQKTSFHHLSNTLGIEDLRSFSITIQQYGYRKQRIVLPSDLNLALADLKDCAATFSTSADTCVTRMDFLVDDESRKAFKSKFRTAFNLWRVLYSFRLFNADLYGPRVRRSIIERRRGMNLSLLLPRPSGDQLVFNVDDIAFRKRHVKSLVYYKQLSDGEHQLLHVLGTIILMDLDTPGALFLLDEPETHFNPEWRAQFVSLLNKVIGDVAESGAPREQEIVLTTHSPFVVSDCQPDRVFLFKRKEKNPAELECISAAEMGINTYGSSVNVLTKRLFEKNATIGDRATETIRAYDSRLKRTNVKSKIVALSEEIETVLGDSAEKVMLLNRVIDKYEGNS